MQQLKATRRSAHEGNRPKRQSSKLSRARSRLTRSQLIDEIRREGQLHEPFDVEKDVEPRLVGFLGEERVAGGRDVPGAQGEEEVQRGGGGLVEGFWVECDEIEGFGGVFVSACCESDWGERRVCCAVFFFTNLACRRVGCR